MQNDEITYCELKSKEIINEVDGRKLGRIIDLIFSPMSGCVLGILAPLAKRTLFSRGQEVYIPFKNIIKIGPDVILVRLTPELSDIGGCVNFQGGGGRHHRQNRDAPFNNSQRGYRTQEDSDRANNYKENRNVNEQVSKRQEEQNQNRTNYSAKAQEFSSQSYEEYPDESDDIERELYRSQEKNECDSRCEKCMLFDCQNRWSSPSQAGN
jgi:YlmC/YmxH family sporulation protein